MSSLNGSSTKFMPNQFENRMIQIRLKYVGRPASERTKCEGVNGVDEKAARQDINALAEPCPEKRP